MELPKDPMMLFSFINMKLRDFYPSLDALCQDMQVNKEEIVNKLKAVGFEYNPEQNKFWLSFIKNITRICFISLSIYSQTAEAIKTDTPITHLLQEDI